MIRNPEEYTFFYNNRTPFSNWYPSTFIVDGVTFTRMEQFMMYRKAMLFGDQVIARQILATDDPAEHQRLGRLVKGFKDSVWNENRVPIVTEGSIAKYEQNEKMKAKLLATDGTILVEASPVDGIWGVKLKVSDPLIHNKNNWRGKNLLGYTLTDVRERMLAGDLSKQAFFFNLK